MVVMVVVMAVWWSRELSAGLTESGQQRRSTRSIPLTWIEDPLKPRVKGADLARCRTRTRVTRSGKAAVYPLPVSFQIPCPVVFKLFTMPTDSLQNTRYMFRRANAVLFTIKMMGAVVERSNIPVLSEHVFMQVHTISYGSVVLSIGCLPVTFFGIDYNKFVDKMRLVEMPATRWGPPSHD